MHDVLCVGMRHVPHLRCSAFLYTTHPALTRWAKVCRASGALQAQRRRAGWKPALRKGTAFRLLPGILRCRAATKEGGDVKLPLQRGAELAGGEIFQGAKACVEFGGRQAALAVKNAQKIRGRTVALARVAFHTGGNQVAVGIASEAHAWHDVVEAPYVRGSAAKAVKASAAFAIVNGFAERPGFQEIRAFERRGRRLPGVLQRAIFVHADSANLLWQPHLSQMAVLAAFQHAQSPKLIQPAHRVARRSDGQTQSAS